MNIVIVGASHAGMAAAAELRRLSESADIILLSAENVLPYQRPPLSKAYVSGDMTLEGLELRPQSWFTDHRIDLRLNTRVTSINRNERQLLLNDGNTVDYTSLILATGSTPRYLPESSGGKLKNVLVMRDLADADALKPLLKSGTKLVVIGGGYVGLEAAAVAAKHGLQVTVVEAAEHILRRVACPQTASYIRELHQAHNVTVLENRSVAGISGKDGKAAAVDLADGTSLPADVVLVGIGVMPQTQLAHDAGLTIANGVVVDSALRTSDPDIYAIGDVASFPRHGTHMRVESVQNAHDQALVAAANALGADEHYNAVPWFWSDQYDLKLQMAGLNTGYTDVIVRKSSDTAQSHFYFDGDTFLATDCFNDAASFVVSRRLLQMGRTITREQAADTSLVLKTLIK
jgi:3-phenylpropionate/trans-cinnamate dioxygenase ferredoxin reductase component